MNSVYVCVCTYVCMCVQACMCVSVCVCACACTCVCVYGCTYIYTDVCIIMEGYLQISSIKLCNCTYECDVWPLEHCVVE
jgi:hypothetical protein